ncbi:H-NS family nucleoid-associated regulatory protein [Rivibacter subsaxonicus]|uniref:DNA-binding protein H-NS n=1 Tax=Rivibacter subsaxonicus TaxID=457575 RepID=A0A4V2FTH0_9BURK|nr:H-NS histone family protein [Rivibacter subsaxonicus]RZT98135.1 DNA-binding protein H-NS [Rivibacter subsaxonicus]
MATYQELLAQRATLEQQQAELERQIADARRAERAGVLAQIKSLMAQHGVTLAELGGAGAKAARGAKPAGTSKVAPKYRNAVTGDTWSGRGLKPKWLQTAIASGRKLEDFKI